MVHECAPAAPDFPASRSVIKWNIMRKIAILALFASCAAAQEPADLFHRAPKSVDDALRARIDEFYQASVKGEFRKAEALVAEDTKDFFYDHDKPRMLSYEISRIDYSNGYTRAKAMILEERHIMLPGFAGKAMKIPTPSYWKIDNGKWCWYVDQAKLNETPFGIMKPGPPAPGDKSPEAILSTIPTDPAEFMKLVHADKSTVDLKPGESDRVIIENGMRGPVTVSVQGKVDGIEAAFDRETIPAGEKATLTLKAAEGAKSGKLIVRAMPLGNEMPIQVTVK
jgi:hypothetical protein